MNLKQLLRFVETVEKRRRNEEAKNDKNNFSNQNKDILLVRICFRYRSKLSHQLTRIDLMIAKKLTSHNQQLKREHV